MDVDQSINEFIEILDKSTSKDDLADAFKSLRTFAHENGLSAIQIEKLCAIATSGKFNSVVTGQIIKCLIPRESVSEDAVLLILSQLCSGNHQVHVQHVLLRWLVLVFDLIATTTKLHALYSVIFHFIESELLCPTVCHLLFLLTRKCDVTHHRISRLLNLQKKIGAQPHLGGLLTVYKMYQPSMVTMSGRFRVFFKKTDQLWDKAIQRVQQKYGLSLKTNRLLASTVKVPSLRAGDLIATPQPNMIQESQQCSVPVSQLIADKIPMHQIKSFQEVLDNFGLLDLSCQAHTLLSSTTLQHVIAVTADRTVAIRLSFWLNHCLRNELINVVGETEKGRELLKTLLTFTNLIQECLPVCEAFLFRYLCTWNGADYRAYILKLVSRLSLMPFDRLHSFVLVPLYKLYTFSNNCYFKCSVVCVLTELLGNYASVELSRYEANLELVQANKELPEESRHSIFPSKQEVFDVHHTIKCLVKFVDDICIEGLESEKDNHILHFYFIQFYKQVSKMHAIGDKPLFCLPSSTFLRKTLFSLNPIYVSSLCSILLNYKNATTEMKGSGILNSSHQSSIQHLNQYLLDTYDTLWRRRAFHPGCSDTSIVYDDLQEQDMDKSQESANLPANRMFSVDRHPAFVAQTARFLSLLQRNETEAIQGEFVMEECHKEFMEGDGFAGIPQLIRSLMTNFATGSDYVARLALVSRSLWRKNSGSVSLATVQFLALEDNYATHTNHTSVTKVKPRPQWD